MNLKNYTSSVNADQTIAKIERLLCDYGASGVMKEFKNKEVRAVNFLIIIPGKDKPMAIRLPADTDAVYRVMADEVRRPRAHTLDRLREQASRTAWKLMQDRIYAFHASIKKQARAYKRQQQKKAAR